MVKIFSFIFAIGLGIQTQAAVWTDVNQWSPEWEAQFNDWVRTSWHVDFFAKKTLANGQANPYYGLSVDCADTVYSMRAIFAYENRLPFVVKDPTAAGKLLSNQMNRWNHLDENARIRSFLRFLYNTLSTRSLPGDTYPVAITRQTIRSGALILTTSKNHHSWTLKEMLPIGVPYLVYNSVVGANSSLTLQQRQTWPNPEWVFEDNFSPTGHAGFRYWRPEAYLNRPVWEVPGYSEEQYKIPLTSWVRQVQKKLALSQESDAQMMTRMMGAFCEGARSRVESVAEGLNYLVKNPKCMTYPIYDNYSTPNRDRRTFDDGLALRRAYRSIVQTNNGNNLPLTLKAQLNKIFPFINTTAAVESSMMIPRGIDSASVCVVEYVSGRKIDLAEFKRRLFAGLISNNPHDSFEYRWGEMRGPSPLAKSCQSWDEWSPNLSGE